MQNGIKNRTQLLEELAGLRVELKPLNEKYQCYPRDTTQALEELKDKHIDIINQIAAKRDEHKEISIKLSSLGTDSILDENIEPYRKKAKQLSDEFSQLKQQEKIIINESKSFDRNEHRRYLRLLFEINQLENRLANPSLQSKAYEEREHGKRHVLVTSSLLKTILQQPGCFRAIYDKYGYEPSAAPKSTDTEIQFVSGADKPVIKLTEDALSCDVYTAQDAKKVGEAMAAIFLRSIEGRVIHHTVIEKTSDDCSDEAIKELERIYAQHFAENNRADIRINGKTAEEILKKAAEPAPDPAADNDAPPSTPTPH